MMVLITLPTGEHHVVERQESGDVLVATLSADADVRLLEAVRLAIDRINSGGDR
jgi:hypothetical protein